MINKKNFIYTFIFSILILSSFVIKQSYEKKYFDKNVYKVKEQNDFIIKNFIKNKEIQNESILLFLINNIDIDLEDNINIIKKNYNLDSIEYNLYDEKGTLIVNQLNKRIDIKELILHPKTKHSFSIDNKYLYIKSITPFFKNDNLKGFLEIKTKLKDIETIYNKEKILILIEDRKSEQFFVHNYSLVKNINDYINPKLIEKMSFDLLNNGIFINLNNNNVFSNYSLYNEQEDFLAYFITITNIDDIEFKNLSVIDFFYSLYLFFLISLFIFIVYTITYFDLKKMNINEYKAKVLSVLFIISSIIYLLFFSFVEYYYENNTSEYNQEQLNKTLIEYDSILSQKTELVNVVFSSLIDKQNILDILKSKDKELLSKSFENDFIKFNKKFQIKEINFYDKNSKLFVSFSKDRKEDIKEDNKIKKSILLANENLIKSTYFENNETFRGYSFVFPILDNNGVNLGIVEITFDIQIILDKYIKDYKINKINLLRHNINNEGKTYLLNDFNIDKEVDKKFLNMDKNFILKNINEVDLHNTLDSVVKNKEAKYLYLSDKEELSFYIPILNNSNNNLESIIILSKQDNYYKEKRNEFQQFAIIVLFFIFVFMMFLFREIITKTEFRTTMIRNKNILDSQKSIIVITNGYDLIECNESLLIFFNIETTIEFKNKYKCVCESFIEEDGYLQKINNNEETWIETILKSQEEFKVKMLDYNKVEHIFKLDINILDTGEYLITFNDITKIENTSNNLLNKTKEQKELLSLFGLGELALFKWKYDKNYTVKYVSENVEKIFGYTQEEFLNNKINYNDLILTEDQNNVDLDIEKAINSNNDFFVHKPYRIKTKDNQIKYLLDNTLILRDKNNEIEEFIGYVIDITHLKNLENKLIQTEKMYSLSEMISNIAHQWRQPLSTISTIASGLKLENQFNLMDDEKLNTYCDKIVENCNLLSDTINIFRDLSKNDVEKSNFNVLKVLKEMLDILNTSLKANYIELIVDIDYSTTIEKEMYRGELSQVISNLINNSKDVLKEKEIKNPFIKVSLHKKKNKIILIVEDNGGGIDKNIKNKIFEPYFTTKHQSQGTGLGLYMTQKIIVESLNGTINVVNTDKGVKFVIEF